MRRIILLFLFSFGLSIAWTQSTPAYWNDILAFKSRDSIESIPKHPILFVGSSSFTKWTDINSYFPGYPIINRGFGGSTLVDVIRYTYDIILPYFPKQVVVYCGENDLANSQLVTPTEVLKRYQTLFRMIRTNLPRTKMSFVSIKPSPVRAGIQPRVIEANRLISSWIKTQQNADFVDIYKPMLDNKGKMREQLYIGDRLHMKPAGYAIWKHYILPHLVK
ncbi:MAG: GDSL-type esterase/lipase family protein [Candidatus Dadabacteria bacterium]